MKADYKLGVEIHDMLVEKGIETPMKTPKGLMPEHMAIEQIKESTENIMRTLGMDLNDDSLRETPNRVAKMYVTETFAGLDYRNFPKITVIDNKMKYDTMLVETGISVKSFCEHHFVAIDGTATVGYIPKDKVIGLSKLNRTVNFFSRRPQVQERLTEQIHAALVYLLGTEDVAVLINAQHLCVKHRGIEDTNSRTITSKLGGDFKESTTTRAEFMHLARMGT